MTTLLNKTSQADTNNIVSQAALTTTEAATYLGLAVSTLNKWRSRGGGPRFMKLGRSVRYRRLDLDAFVEERIFNSTLEI